MDDGRLQVDEVLGDGCPTLETLKAMPFTVRVINEAMRLYPQPPVLIRYTAASRAEP